MEYDADPGQIERLIAKCGLEGSSILTSPGFQATFHELEEDVPLPKGLHTAFRAAAARGNYFAADRIAMQFACKGICRSMSAPGGQSWKAFE